MLTLLFPDLAPALRLLLAGVTSCLFVLWAIPLLARTARRRRFGDREDKTFSDTLNQLHAGKRSTPIVGGIALVGGVLLATLLAADLTATATWALLGTVLGLASLGFLDDYRKTFGAVKTAGLSARQKLVGQVLLGFGVGLFLIVQAARGGALSQLTTIGIPFVEASVGVGAVGFLLLAVFLVTGSSNAVNLTDGLDGLAGGCAVVAFCVYMAVAASVGAVEVAVVLSALTGGLAAFLCFNRHPAQVFMGDTGSLPLGGALAVAALLTKQELLLAIVGGVFVAEALSVMTQVAWFKLTGKRIFRCAPLHHHFEFKGWPETQVVSRFHVAALALGIVGLVGAGLIA